MRLKPWARLLWSLFSLDVNQAYNGDSCEFSPRHTPRITGTEAFTYHVAAGLVMDSLPLMYLARSPQAVRVRAVSSYPF